MTPSDLKPRIDFASQSEVKEKDLLQPAQHFDESLAEQAFTAEPQQVDQEEDDEALLLAESLRPKNSLWRRLLLLGLVILLVSGLAQLIQHLFETWNAAHWLDFGVTTAGVCVVAAGVGALLTEVKRLRRLRHQVKLQQTASELLTSTGFEQGRLFCEQLLKHSGLEKHHPAVAQWYAALDASQTDGEVVKLYAQIVQPVIDKQAQQLITKTATQSAIMVAASPFALVDMGLVAWRSLRMVNHIARLYQVEPGYIGRIRLLRVVLFNMAFVGTTEWVQDSGIDWLTQDVAGRISARIAQGVGIGLLTSRLGVKTMTLCRPVPWVAQQQPKLGHFRRSLLQQLKQLFT